MNYKKISELSLATGIDPQDLFMLVDVSAQESKNCTVQVLKNAMSFSFNTDDILNLSTQPGSNVTQALNNIQSGGGGSAPAGTQDVVSRYDEGSDYSFSRDADGFIQTITTHFGGGLSKVWTFTRDIEGMVSNVNIHRSDSTFDKTYTFNRDADGFVSSISIV
jgi:hypothetical protein